MGAFLEPVDNGRRIPLDKAVVFIGRHPDCDVVLTRSRKVSRKHCCVAQVDDRYVVRDLGSMNGVRVNGRKIAREATLRTGDEVAIGDLRYVIQCERAKKPGPRKSNGAGATKPPAAPHERPVPLELSQEFPVAIPDSDESFQAIGSSEEMDAVDDAEQSASREPSGDVYRLSEDEPDNANESFVDLKPE